MFTIRPSSLGGFLGCAWQWKLVHLDGKRSIPSARAAVGTSIHKAAEIMWTEAIETGKKDLNVSKAQDIAAEEFKRLAAEDDLQYEEDMIPITASGLAAEGAKVFMQDIAPSTDIPDAVEKRYSIEFPEDDIQIAGSIDYVKGNIIGDIKTTKRKPSMDHYMLQQGAYAVLRDANGEPTDVSRIQAIVFTKEPYGTELSLSLNKLYSKYTINSIIEKVMTWREDKVPPELLFSPNPSWYLCDKKYCAFYGTDDCKATKGWL